MSRATQTLPAAPAAAVALVLIPAAQVKFLRGLGELAMVERPAPLVARRGGMRADDWQRAQRAWAEADQRLQALLGRMTTAQIDRALDVLARLDGAEVFRAAAKALATARVAR